MKTSNKKALFREAFHILPATQMRTSPTHYDGASRLLWGTPHVIWIMSLCHRMDCMMPLEHRIAKNPNTEKTVAKSLECHTFSCMRKCFRFEFFFLHSSFHLCWGQTMQSAKENINMLRWFYSIKSSVVGEYDRLANDKTKQKIKMYNSIALEPSWELQHLDKWYGGK